jgi:hypothetical protein
VVSDAAAFTDGLAFVCARGADGVAAATLLLFTVMTCPFFLLPAGTTGDGSGVPLARPTTVGDGGLLETGACA